jgi:hypothetical protein
VIDEAKVTDNKVTITIDGSSGKYMHGKHSWKVEGPSSDDVVVSQLLSREVVEYIRNRKPDQNRGVSFSFWYNVSEFAGDGSGSRNKARAEIDYHDGSWHTMANLTVKPVNKVWHMAQANCRLP